MSRDRRAKLGFVLEASDHGLANRIGNRRGLSAGPDGSKRLADVTRRPLGSGTEASYRCAVETRMVAPEAALRTQGDAWLSARLENSWRTPS
jgi:hypothetical protein